MILEKLAKTKGVESYVVTAIPHGSRVYVAFNVVNRDAYLGSAVIAVERASLAATLVYESKQVLIDYVIDGDGWQLLLLDDRVVEIEPDGEPVDATKKIPAGLYRLSALGGRRAAVCGDAGAAFVYAKRKFTKIATVVDDPKYPEDLRSIHFATPSRGYAVGDYGLVLKGDTKKLAPLFTKTNPFEIEGGRSPVLSVYETKRGALLLGSDDGPAVVVEKGKATKLTGLPADSKVFAMVELHGDEYWSTSGFELFNRKGAKLKKRPEAAGGYRMEANADVLASSCGSFVYLYDGKVWTRLRINPNPKKLVERLKLDFKV